MGRPYKILTMIALLLTALAAQDAPPPHPKHTVELKASVVERDGHHVFVVEGTSDLPADVELRARIYAVEVVNHPQKGDQESEEPMVWEDDEGQPAWRKFTVANGRFKEDVYSFIRAPWAIRYRARIHYLPRDQSDAVVQRLGQDEHSWAADLRLDDPKVFAEQMRVRLQEACDDLLSLKAWHDELQGRFEAQQRAPDEAAWRAWKGPWFERVERMLERNKLRYGLWSVWMERQAKMRVGGQCEVLRRLLVAAGEHLFEDKAKTARFKETAEVWMNMWEEAVEVIGCEIPLDEDKVKPAVAAVGGAVARLREAAGKGPVPPEVLSEVRRDGMTAILKLAPHLRIRKRGYKALNDLSARFTALLQAADGGASPDGLRAPMEELDQALAAFARYAGVK